MIALLEAVAVIAIVLVTLGGFMLLVSMRELITAIATLLRYKADETHARELSVLKHSGFLEQVNDDD